MIRFPAPAHALPRLNCLELIRGFHRKDNKHIDLMSFVRIKRRQRGNEIALHNVDRDIPRERESARNNAV